MSKQEMSVNQLVANIEKGYIQKPEMQREYVWKATRVRDLEFFVVSQPASWFNTYDRWRQYDLGGMLVEVLTAVNGPASTMEVWKQCGSGMKFPDAFEKVYGISFAKALPIISKAIALEIGRS